MDGDPTLETPRAGKHSTGPFVHTGLHRIVHVITGLVIRGGAETLLREVALSQIRAGHRILVITLRSGGVVADELKALGVPVVGLGECLRSPTAAIRLIQRLRAFAPEVVHTWLYHADLVGGIFGKLLGSKVVWSLHHCDPAVKSKFVTRIVSKVCAIFSPWLPNQVVAVSEHALWRHRKFGYRPRATAVVHNGIKAEWLTTTESRDVLRERLGIPTDCKVVLHIGRWNPIKDHATFIRAAGLVAATTDKVAFAMVGRDITSDNGELSALVDQVGVGPQVLLLGEQADLSGIYAAADVYVSTSLDESFGLTILEAMVAGLPVVATNIETSRMLLGSNEALFHPGDYRDLSALILNVMRRPHEENDGVSRRNKERALKEFSYDAMLKEYEDIYSALIGGGR